MRALPPLTALKAFEAAGRLLSFQKAAEGLRRRIDAALKERNRFVFVPEEAQRSAEQGINQRIAEGLGLHGITSLLPNPEGQGTGRWGWLGGGQAVFQVCSRFSLRSQSTGAGL